MTYIHFFLTGSYVLSIRKFSVWNYMFQYFDRNLTNQTLYLYVLHKHLLNLRVVQNWYLQLKTFSWSVLDVRQSISSSIFLLFEIFQLLFYQEYHENRLHISDVLYSLYNPSKQIHAVFDRLLNSNIAYKLLCGQAMFLWFSFLSLFLYLLNR